MCAFSLVMVRVWGVSCSVMNVSMMFFICSAVGKKSATPYILKRDKRRRRKSVRTLFVHGRERL